MPLLPSDRHPLPTRLPLYLRERRLRRVPRRLMHIQGLSQLLASDTLYTFQDCRRPTHSGTTHSGLSGMPGGHRDQRGVLQRPCQGYGAFSEFLLQGLALHILHGNEALAISFTCLKDLADERMI